MTVQRNKTRRARQEAKSASTIAYDLTKDHSQAGRARNRTRKPAALRPASGVVRPRGTLGPSGLPMLRTSERGTFKRCRFLYELEYVRLLKPHMDTPPLLLGSWIHVGLAAFYKKGIRRGPHPARTFEKEVIREAERVAKLTKRKPYAITEQWSDLINLGVGMLENYIDHYGKDDEYKVLATEHPFKVIVPHPRDGVTPWFWYTGVVDNLLEHRPSGRKLIRDHKSTAQIVTKYLALDDQTTAYWTWGYRALRNAGYLGPQEIPDGLQFNFLRKQKPDERPFIIEPDGTGQPRKYYTNQDGSVSKKQPAPYFLRHTLQRGAFEKAHAERRVLKEFRDMETVRRNPEENVYKNPTKWTCPGCWAFDICELHEVGADYESVIEQTTRTWDPYEQHEVYVGETK